MIALFALMLYWVALKTSGQRDPSLYAYLGLDEPTDWFAGVDIDSYRG